MFLLKSHRLLWVYIICIYLIIIYINGIDFCKPSIAYELLHICCGYNHVRCNNIKLVLHMDPSSVSFNTHRYHLSITVYSL